MLAGLGCARGFGDVGRVLRVNWDELGSGGVGRAGQESAVSVSTRHCGVGSSRQRLPAPMARVLGAGYETRGADPVCPIPFLLNDSG